MKTTCWVLSGMTYAAGVAAAGVHPGSRGQVAGVPALVVLPVLVDVAVHAEVVHVQRALGRVQVAGRNGPGRGWEPADRRGEVLFVPASVPRELMQVAVGTDEGDDLPEAGVVGEADRHAVGQHRAAGGTGQVVV